MVNQLEKFAAVLNGKGGCKDCQNEVIHQVKEALDEANKVGHSHLAEIAYANKILVGVLQRLLTKYEEAEGTPKNVAYVFSQSSPSQSTSYSGNPLPYDGVIRSLVVSGPGNVTLKLTGSKGTVTLAILSCNGNAVPLQIRHKMAVGASLNLSTDSNAGTGLLALTAWIEPIIESGPELFRLRR